MHDQISNFFIVVSGFVSVAIGIIFDVPPAFLAPAVLGSSFGVAFSRPTDKLVGAGLIIFGTICTGYAMPELQRWLPDTAIGTLAFFGSLLLIGFRLKIYAGVGYVINAAFEAAGSAIKASANAIAAKFGGKGPGESE